MSFTTADGGMSVHPPSSFDDELHQRVYEYVERHGAVESDELARSIRIESERAQSKPARADTYTESVCPPTEDLESCLETLKERGYLTESNGKLRVAVPGTTVEHECNAGTVTIRPAREEDRDDVIEVMRTVADEGTYIVAENVATELERDSALVRATEDRSRVCFVATLVPEDDEAGDGDVVAWLHVDAHELPSLAHTAELTVGVAPAVRRQGIGSALLEYGLEWADEVGYRKLYQNVPATNEGAIAFLEDNGWKREGVHEDQYRIDDEFVDEVMLSIWP